MEGVDDDSRVLYFADGKLETGYDLVVGADGSWSCVRRVLSDQGPVYAGLAGWDFSTSDTGGKALECAELVGDGYLFSFSDGRSIMSQRMGDGSIAVSVWGRRDEMKTGSRPVEDNSHRPCPRICSRDTTTGTRLC